MQLLVLVDSADGDDARMRDCPFHTAAVEASGVVPGVEHIVHLHKRDTSMASLTWPERLERGTGDAGQPASTALRGRVCPGGLAQRSGSLAACLSGGGPHFDVVAAARTASLTAVGVIATTAFWARLTISSR